MKSRDSHVEYLWIDGALPNQRLRSKTLVLEYTLDPQLEDFPRWGFDGSLTSQGRECYLNPTFFCKDPIRGAGCYIVLCEVLASHTETHESNERAQLRLFLREYEDCEEIGFGFEQEYTLTHGVQPLGWPEAGFPRREGAFYCGVGSRQVSGREITEDHLKACSAAELNIFGVRAGEMPGQWAFQIGCRGRKNERSDALFVSDQLWVARYLLERISEEYGVAINWQEQAIEGAWSSASLTAKFSSSLLQSPSIAKKMIRHLEQQWSLQSGAELNSSKFFKIGAFQYPIYKDQEACFFVEDSSSSADTDPYGVCLRLLESILALP